MHLHLSSGKRVVGLDFDDTVVDTTGALVRSIERELGVPVEPGNISDFNYWASLGFDRTQALDFCREQERAGYPGIELVPEVDSAIVANADRYKFVIVTARLPEMHSVTWDTLAATGLAAYIEEVYHSANPFHSGALPSKAEICLDIGAAAFFDNEVPNVNACHDSGVSGHLFGDKGFRDVDPRIGVSIVPDWVVGSAYLSGAM